MAILNCRWMSLRAPCQYPWNAQVALVLVAFITPIDGTRAAPITLRFDATITNVLAGKPFDLPFTYQVGDVISGKLTFDPDTAVATGDNSVEANQSLGLEFVIDGIAVGSSTYSIRAINDSPISDDVIQGPVDTMTVRCSPSSPQACSPALISLPGADPFSIGVRLSLIGPDSIFGPPQFSTPELSADPANWNSFLFERHLGLSFRSQNIGSLSISATVGTFSLVPEPSAISSVSLLLFCMGMDVTRKRQRRTNRWSNAAENR